MAPLSWYQATLAFSDLNLALPIVASSLPDPGNLMGHRPHCGRDSDIDMPKHSLGWNQVCPCPLEVGTGGVKEGTHIPRFWSCTARA